jgi:hypothetical protein
MTGAAAGESESNRNSGVDDEVPGWFPGTCCESPVVRCVGRVGHRVDGIDCDSPLRFCCLRTGRDAVAWLAQVNEGGERCTTVVGKSVGRRPTLLI